MMGQWPRDDRREAAAVVLVERAALSSVKFLPVSREHTGDLRQRTVIPRRMLHHVARQKTNTAAINAVIDPDGSDRRLLLPLHQYLHLAEVHDNVLRQHFPAVDVVLLTGASLVTPLCPDNLHHNAGRMHRRRRILGGREGRHGENCRELFVPRLSTQVFFRTHSHISTKTCPTNGILGIARKLLTRRTHLACLLNAIV